MKAHLYDFRWTSPEGVEFQASVNEKFGKKPVTFGQKLSLEVVSPPYCSGSNADGVWKPCPENQKGKAKCDLCRVKEGSFVYTAFDGFNKENVSEQDLGKLSNPHVVYFALFDREIVKVGVSNESRKELRQIEQGAQFTLFIAQTSDGVAARQIETLFRQSGLADKITSSQKKDFLCPEITEEEGQKILEEIFEKHRPALDEHEHLKDLLFEKGEFVSWVKTYHLENIDKSTKGVHSVKLNEGESVSGKVIAMKGPFIVLETEDEMVSLCSKDLLGKDIEFEDKPVGLQVASALQNSLF